MLTGEDGRTVTNPKQKERRREMRQRSEKEIVREIENYQESGSRCEGLARTREEQAQIR